MRYGMMFALLALAACGGDEGDTGTLPDGDPVAGEQVYADTCAVCHGASGEGGSGPALAEAAGESESELANVIQNGEGDMPAQDLDDQQTADVIAYIQDTF